MGRRPGHHDPAHPDGEAFPGVTNVAVFGQTEMSPVTCALSGEDALRKIGSVGKPVSIVAARIVDDD